MTTKSLLGALAVAALALAGCTQNTAVEYDDANTFTCLDHSIDAGVLAAATPIAELTGAAAEAITQATWDDGSDLVLENEADWYLAGGEDGDVLIMRDIPTDEVVTSGPPNSDREVILLHWIEDSPNLADGWYVWANSVCPLTIDLGDLAVPTVQLDPASPPDPTAMDVHLLVTEAACNSGQSAEGRVRVVSLVETDESVTVTIGVAPNSGNHTCPSNPATPYVVTLSAPLGDRTLIDGTRALPITAP